MNYVTAQGGRPDMQLINEGCPEQLKTVITDEDKRPTVQHIIDILSSIF
jgi:hypothetical protein